MGRIPFPMSTSQVFLTRTKSNNHEINYREVNFKVKTCNLCKRNVRKPILGATGPKTNLTRILWVRRCTVQQIHHNKNLDKNALKSKSLTTSCTREIGFHVRRCSQPNSLGDAVKHQRSSSVPKSWTRNLLLRLDRI